MDTIVQCKSCPWKVGCIPDEEIPGYDRELHEKLTRTIASGIESIPRDRIHIMACHYSKTGAEHACAGWLHNQLGPGNNIGVRIMVSRGAFPVPEVDGEQHECFEDTIQP